MLWSGRVSTALLVAALAALLPVPVRGQADHPLVTDRPDFTESAVTVPGRSLQLESGYTFTRAGDADEHALGEILLRIGVIHGLEARLGVNSHTWVESIGDDVAGFEDPSLGLKWVLSEEGPSGGGLASALLLATSVPVGDGDLGEEEWQPELKLAASRGLTGALALAANVGYAYPSEDGRRFDQGSASLSLGIGLSERWGAYLEGFTIFPSGPSGDDEVVANGGLTFLVHPLLQLDARAGGGLTHAAPDFFVGVGVARRW